MGMPAYSLVSPDNYVPYPYPYPQPLVTDEG
jgi:hypothetical protein